ncbi:hypothetical protein [Streptococcus sp. M334]|jgi:hypothetical protein|uniref:hypothetical protein n=1 Tax=Streptococcus sp. M334 TaxID=563038 RepID=UPI0001F89458|nr:hypothetical protein [Streptococcus sp. M334]EFX59023.1 hypothetical protein HMPREF0851_01095 [Streptococcus sp. M334]MDU2537556.1 adhesin [Streptococcus mitis]
MESSWSILLGLAVINLPFLLIVIIGDRISGQSIKNLHPKDNKIISESELNSTNMNNISPRLKPRLVILVLCVISFLFFGFKGNGEVIYYGANFEAGSVFYPESYTSYGLFKGLSNELNKLVAKKRHSSLMGVIVSFSIGGIVSYSLWKDDEFKELLIELRKY